MLRPLARVLFLLFLCLATVQAKSNDYEIALATPETVAKLILENHLLQPQEAALRAAAWSRLGGGGSWGELRQSLRAKRWTSPKTFEVAMAMIDAMTQELKDPYSFVLTPRERQWEMEVQKSGQFTGVGVELAPRNGLSVVACLDGGPAKRAGLQAGDQVLAIDGKPVRGESFYAAGNRLLGRRGAPVVLTVLRGEQKLDLRIVRERLALPGVKSKLLDHQIGFLKIGFFSPDTGAQVRQALRALKSQGANKLIVDLRSNPGGSFEQGSEVVKLFGKGICLYLEERPEPARALQAAESDPDHWSGPVVALVDGGTASAAEMVATALKGRGNSLLVGQRTFGKARIQTLYKLPGGGAINLSTGRFLTAKREAIHDRGIAPNVVVSGDPLPRALDLLSD